MDRRNFLLSTLLSGVALKTLNADSKITPINKNALKLGYLPITDHLLITAKDLYGSNFTPIKFSSWADLSEALRAKAIDGAFILTPLALKLKSSGIDIKALLAAHRNGSALALKKGLRDSSSDASALKGLKIAIPSRFSTHYLLLANLFKSANLSLDDVTLIDMPPTEMVFSLASNSIDGFIAAEPFAFVAQKRNVADIFRLSKDIINNHICCILVFHNDILQSQTSEVLKLVNNFLHTADLVQHDEDSVANASVKFLGQKADLIKELLKEEKRIIFEQLKLTPEDIQKTLNDMKEYNVANLNITYADFVDNRFIDTILGTAK